MTAIKENHERRMARLEEMIEERRRMTEDHESGRRKLSDEEYDRASRQVHNFQRKLDQMKQRNSDEVSSMFASSGGANFVEKHYPHCLPLLLLSTVGSLRENGRIAIASQHEPN